MNAQHIENKPKVRKETKNKIRVDFERAPLKERLKAKFLSLYFLKRVVWYVFRLILLIGIAYIVLFPFFSKIAGSFMGPDDFVDVTVRLIPNNFSVDMYKAIWTENHYLEAFGNTLLLSGSTALVQTFICSFVAYGLAKFKFKGNGLVFLAVIFSLTIPPQTLQLSLFMKFLDFDVLGIVQFLNGGGIELFGNTFLEGIDIIPDTENWGKIFQNGYGMTLTNTYWPLIILSLCGLAFKNGLYIFMLRQFFRGVPDELEESAYVDGSGVYRTFLQIILPLSIPMMITIFLLSFSWQWTDNFYTTLFYSGRNAKWLMPNIVSVPPSLVTNYPGQGLFYSAINNTCALLIMAPLVIIYLFCQRYLIQGIERSGIVG